MAGIRVVQKDNHGTPTSQLCPHGYVRIVEKIIMDPVGFDGFERLSPPARADFLKDAILNKAYPPDNDLNCVVTTLNNATEVNKNTCNIKLDKDKDNIQSVVSGPNGRAQHTLPYPDKWVPDLGYLDDYICEFLNLWNHGHQDAARKFLYGTMMLTKCR